MLAWDAIADGYRYILYGGARGGGKDLDINTPICTITGWTTMGEIVPGDVVFGSDGNPCNVLAVSEIMYNKDYLLTFSDGSEIICGEGHQWITETKADRVSKLRHSNEWRERRRDKRPSRGSGKRPDLALRNSTQEYHYLPVSEPIVKTTQEIVDTLTVSHGREVNHAVMVCKPLNLPEKELAIDPYVLGAWLGDGTSSAGEISGIDQEIFDRISESFTVTDRSVSWLKGILGLRTILRKESLIKNKHIPQEYLRSSVEQRLALLQGLMDTDGTCDERGQCEFTNVNKTLIFDVQELILSLGIKATIRVGRATLYGKDCGEKYRIKFITDLPVFCLKRKADRQKIDDFRGTHQRRYIVSAEQIKTVPTKCIEVDSPDHTYLAGRTLIPTHNSRFLRWALVAWLYMMFKMHGLTHVRVGLFCETYTDLRDRQINKMRLEFPEWMGVIKKTDSDGLCFFMTESLGSGIIALRNLDDPSKYQSAEFAAIAVDELTKILKETFDILRGSLRWPGVKRTLFLAATNPGGIGHSWVKQLWLDKDFPPEMRAISKRFKFIQSLPSDNPHLEESYWEELDSLPEDLRRAWVFGDWDVFAGQAFPTWRPHKHIIQPFEIPQTWTRWRCLDWGYDKPFCCLWMAKDPANGRTVVYKEAYGVLMTDTMQAQKIKDMSEGEYLLYTLADPSLWKRMNFQGHVTTTADEFGLMGVPLSRADNNRLQGKRKIDRLLADMPDGKPGLLFFSNCKNSIRTIPTLARNERNPEDVDGRGEDHCFIAGTMIATHTGDVSIEQIKRGDKVLTRRGYKQVLDIWDEGEHPVYSVIFSNGKELVGTGNHPVYANNQWIRIDALRYGDSILPKENIHLTKSIVPENVVVLHVEKINSQRVYNLSVADQHEYFANGILVHNCYDCLRYGLSNFILSTPVKKTYNNPWLNNQPELGSEDARLFT